MTEKLLTPNKWSRPRLPLLDVRVIVLHWLLNPGQSVWGAWKYWDNRKAGETGYGAGHILIGDDTTVLAIPLDEVAYHVGTLDPTPFAFECVSSKPNFHSIGVEMTHPDISGEPTGLVRARAISICIELCQEFNVPAHMICTHFDIAGMQEQWVGRPCHRWYVEQPGELARFQSEVNARL